MFTRAFKQNPFIRALSCIIIISFILSGAPARLFAGQAVSDNLRPRAAERDGGGAADQIRKDLLAEDIVVAFKDLGKDDVAIAGGKGANLGELQKVKGITVPDGVAVTTKAFRLHIDQGTVSTPVQGEMKTITLREYIELRIKDLDYDDSVALASAGEDIRKAIVDAEMPREVKEKIATWYGQFSDMSVAVRSSATAEDTADASFAGQQDTYLNIRGEAQVLSAVKRNWASLFTDRAIYYRHNQGIDHGKAFLSAIIQRMVPSRVAGTSFSVEVSTGFPSMKIDAAWGLGEGVVSGSASPDSYVVKKDSLGSWRIYRKSFGAKLQKVDYRKVVDVNAKEGTELRDTSYTERHSFALTDEQVLEVAKAVEAIHKYYGMYMDVEWAFDPEGKLWILQARPETVWNKWEQANPNTTKMTDIVVPEEIADKTQAVLSGVSGALAAVGKVVIIDSTKEGKELAADLNTIKQGDILVTQMTKPDMVPAMQRAGAIVTNEGGPTCHAMIIARELGVPCIVGTGNATQILKDGDVVTVDSNRGKVFAGALDLKELKDNVPSDKLPIIQTKVGIIVASPQVAMKMWGLSKFPSHYGVGLLRAEFAHTTEILVHPLAGLAWDMYNDPNFKDEAQRKWIKENIIDNKQLREAIEETVKGYPSFAEFFKEKLANTVALIAATQTGGQRVKYRTTDFKTNEYRDQIGGSLVEPDEKNPMMGYRGINRMLSDAYRNAFELEIEAIKMAREKQKNIDVMFPVVRTIDELDEAIALFAKHGLVRGKDGFQIGMMVEVPANIFQADEFFQRVDFMSIGSNDMTQFTLALGRDNMKMKSVFDETNPAVKKGLEIVIKAAKRAGVTSGLCGQRPSNDPKFAAFLKQAGIDSISVVPESYRNVVNVVAEQERALAGKPFDPKVAGWTIPGKIGYPELITAADVDAGEVIKNLKIHPKVLLDYNAGKAGDPSLSKEIEKLLAGRTAKQYVIDMVSQEIKRRAENTPSGTPLIYNTDDLDKTEYELLLGGKNLEGFDENPQLGFTGLARVVDPDYQEFFRWQLEGVKQAREATGRKNIGIRLDLARTLTEVDAALKIMKEAGLTPGTDGFMVGMELAGPANALLINEFIAAGINFLSENNDRFLSYDMAVDPGNPHIRITDKQKRTALEIPRRIWTDAAQRSNIPFVQDAQGTIQLSDKLVYQDVVRGYEALVKTFKDVKNTDGIVVFGANSVLKNAATMTALQTIKDNNTDFKFIIWAKDAATAEALKKIGVEKAAQIIISPKIEMMFKELEKYGTPNERIRLINTDLDVKGAELAELIKSKPGVQAINLKASEKQAINSMPLVIARAIASILRQEKAVVYGYKELAESYGIQPADREKLNDLTSEILEMPLVVVSDEVVKDQIAYEAVGSSI